MTKLIDLTDKQTEVLQQFIRCRNNPQWLVTRSQIIVELSTGTTIKQTARKLGISRNTVRTWLRRWNQQSQKLGVIEAETTDDSQLKQAITTVLIDDPRSGRPADFTPEQIVQIVALACENSQHYQRPISHWTPRELADEAIKQGIVSEISPRSVGRFLKSGGFEASSKPLLASSEYR